MNIGWIFFGCALIVVVILILQSGRRKERIASMENMSFSESQNSLARLDEFDARLTRRDEIVSLLRGGQQIKAIKVYREDTGASLRDAKAAVERMELALRLSGSPAPVTSGDVGASWPTGSDAEAVGHDALDLDAQGTLRAEVEQLLRQGQKIRAIKLYRERTGMDLAGAKGVVDQLEQTMRRQGFQSASPYQSLMPGSQRDAPGEEARRHLLVGDKIRAIKAYREQTGLSLKDAKEEIDRLG